MSARTLPKKVLLREDGPREGFQMLDRVVPTAEKLRLIEALTTTGISTIEVTSFVRPDRVPQMADAEELARALAPKSGVRFRALYLNETGFEKACTFPALTPEGMIHLAVSETFLKTNNNISLDDALNRIPKWIALFKEKGIKLERLMISTAFGDHAEGKIPAKRTLDVCRRAIQKVTDTGSTTPEITLADTTGFGNPESVKQLVAEAKNLWPEIVVGLHLHDTRGTGMANVYAGLEEGVSRFDCSVGGLGGCPFTKGAAGNVPTEDVAFLCEELGVRTGLNLEAYVECARFAEQIAGRPLPGKLKTGGLLGSLSGKCPSTS